MVFEPAVELEVNLLKHFRMGIHASYRFMKDVNMDGVSPDAFNGFTTGLSMKLRAF